MRPSALPRSRRPTCVSRMVQARRSSSRRSPRRRRSRRRPCVNFGNTQVELELNGEELAIEQAANPVGYEFTADGEEELPEGSAPARERSRRHRRHRHRGTEWAGPGPERPGSPTGWRSSAWSSRTSRSAATGRRTWRRSSASWPTRGRPHRHERRPRPDGRRPDPGGGGRVHGPPLRLDEALEGRIAAILERLSARWRRIDREAVRAANRKQALACRGRRRDRAGRHRARRGGARGERHRPSRGRPGSTPADGDAEAAAQLHEMWPSATRTEAFQASIRGRTTYKRMLRLFGIPESSSLPRCARPRRGSTASRSSRSTSSGAARSRR